METCNRLIETETYREPYIALYLETYRNSLLSHRPPHLVASAAAIDQPPLRSLGRCGRLHAAGATGRAGAADRAREMVAMAAVDPRAPGPRQVMDLGWVWLRSRVKSWEAL